MGNVHSTVPPDLVCMLRDDAGIRTAIETGTWKAASALVLAGIFEHVYSIELLPEIWETAKEKHRNVTNLVFVNASSPLGLRDLGSRIDGPTLFWLDAHGGLLYTAAHSRERGPCDGPTSGGAETQCPLLDEIRAIDVYPRASESCILIDDARAFVTPLPGRRNEDWPPLAEVFDALRAMHPRFVTIVDDIIIAVPPSLRSTIENWRQQKLREREGLEYHEYRLRQLANLGVREVSHMWLLALRRKLASTPLCRRLHF